MEKLTRILLLVSAVFALFIAGLAVYAGTADSKWYGVAVLCVFVTIWFTISFVKSTKEAKRKKEESQQP